MKKFNRYFSILMCLCLLGTSTLGDTAMALAEETVVDTASGNETGGNEAVPDHSDAESELELDVGEVELTPAPQEIESVAARSVDYNAPASASPEFEFGYAKLLSDAALFAESGADAAVSARLKKDGIVLVTERVTGSEDRLHVVFDCEGSICEGWMDAYALRPMAEDEIDAFQNGITEAVCYQDNVEYPLMQLTFLPVDDTAEKPAEPTEGPEETDSELDTVEDENSAANETDDNDAADADIEADENGASVEEGASDEGSTSDKEGASDEDGTIDEDELTAGDDSLDPVDNAAQDPVASSPATPENGDNGQSSVVAMELFNDEIELPLGETAPIEVVFSDGVSREVSYGIQNSGVVSVDENGMMTAIAAGETSVTVMCREIAASAVLYVTVYDPDMAAAYTLMTMELDSEEFTVKLDNDSLNVGQMAQVTVDVSSGSIDYASSDETVAAVDTTGKVTAVGKGRCTITVTVDGTVESVDLTVYDEPDTLELVIESAKLVVGGQTEADVVFPEYTRTSIEYSSSDPSVATVDEDGVVTAVAIGTCEIIATGENSVVDSLEIEVIKPDTVLNEKKLVLDVGNSFKLTYSSDNPENVSRDISFVSADPEIVEIDPTSGVMVAISEGATGVKLMVDGVEMSTCAVTVCAAEQTPADMKVESDAILILSGRSIKLPVVFLDENGNVLASEYVYRLQSSDARIVTVTAAGEVVAKGYGWTTVTVTTDNGLSATCQVGVVGPVTKTELLANGAAIGSTGLQIGEGMTQKVDAKLYYSASGYNMYGASDYLGLGEFSVGDAGIATVDRAGNVKGLKKGETTLTFRPYSGNSLTVKVQVVGEPTAVYLNKTSTQLGVGMTETLTVSFPANEYGSVTFSSSDKSVATIDSTGTVTAVATGKVLIKAEAYNGKYTTCELTVIDAPDQIALSTTRMNVPVGKKFSLSPVVSNENGECMAELRYASSRSNIASVDANGQITAIAAGTAIIRIMTQNDLYVDCTVVVQPAATSVVLSTTTCSLGVGQTAKIMAKVNTASGSFIFSEGDYEYACFESNDSSIVTIDPVTGVVTAVAQGIAYVRLVTTNGKYALCKVEVGPGAEWLMFDEIVCTLGVGQSKLLTCDKSAGSITTRTYTSSNPSVLSVDGNDATCTIKALSVGEAIVTATSSNGKTTTCTVTVKAEPEKVEFAESSITIGINEKVLLPQVTVSSSKGECMQNVTYTASNTNVVVSSTGYVTGIKDGSTTITATAYNGKSATITVRVLPQPSSISLTAEKSKIAVGDTLPLKVTLDAPGTYTFSADKEGIVKISNGAATALAVGTVTITATTYNGLSDSITLEVLPVPANITLNIAETSLGVGMTQKLNASIPTGSLGTWSFKSSNPSVAAVDATGVVTAKATGTAEISVFVDGHENIFDTCQLTVLPMPSKISLSATTMAIKTGATAQLTATMTGANGETCYGKPVFTSSNNAVATVDNGRITAVGQGTAVITVAADADSTIKATCTVSVSDANVRFNESELTLGVGEVYALSLVIPEKQSDYSIVSSNAAVATVTEDGKITAVSQGTATITAINGGDRAECKVTVAARPTSVQLSDSTKQLIVGDSFQLSASLLPEGSASVLTYVSGNTSVATVTADGLVTAVGYGTTEIKVLTYDAAVYAICTVKAVYEPEMIRFGELNDLVIAVGDSYPLEAPVMYSSKGECDSTYTLSISNSSCVSISLTDGRYVIKALQEGTATLRIKTANGLSASLDVTVTAAPKSIRFADATIRLGVGEHYVPTLLGDNEAMVSCTLTSGNTGVIRIENGEMYAVATGSATVTATSVINSALKATITVEVVNAPADMRFDRSACTLGVGESIILETSFAPGTAAMDVTFTSDNESVVQVDRRGYVRAVGTGTAKVKGTAYNGSSAECVFTVKKTPTAMTISPANITACVKDSVQLTARFGAADEYANVMFESSNPAVVEVSDSGLLSFKQVGEAVIFAETFNGLSAEVAVTVCETPSSVGFEFDSAVILKGDSAKLEVVFDKGAGYYTLTSSNPAAVKIADDGSIEALALGKSTIALTMPGLNLSAKCTVEVVDKLDGVVVIAQNDSIGIDEQTQLSYTLFPSNAIGTGLVHFESANPDMATVDSATGIVTGVAYGTAKLRAIAGDGTSGECEINVKGGKRRMMVAYYFGEASDGGAYLPFAYNNGTSMVDAFSAAEVEGQTYDIAGPLSNASKSILFATMDAHFADATDDDVSVIYLLAHGAYGSEYFFALHDGTIITGRELMDHLEKIKGKVIMIMDSCYSGGLIQDCRARAEAEGGRICFLTSSHHTTNSCYWDVPNKLQSIDFFTFGLLRSIGYNEWDGWEYSHGFHTTTPESDVNGDGVVTVQEAFDYAKRITVWYVTNLSGYRAFRGNAAQVPNSYISAEMQDVALFSR